MKRKNGTAEKNNKKKWELFLKEFFPNVDILMAVMKFDRRMAVVREVMEKSIGKVHLRVFGCFI